MAKECAICNRPTIFYIWNTAGNLDTDKIPFHIKKPYVICIGCCIKHNLFKNLDYSKVNTEPYYGEFMRIDDSGTEASISETPYYTDQEDW